MLKELVSNNRSTRRFDGSAAVSRDTLETLVDLARLAPSGANLQPLKYILACSPDRNGRIFPCLGWAGYLRDWPGPTAAERPGAYIIILGDTNISRDWEVDVGIAAQTMMLGAAEQGLRGCMIGSVDKPALRQALTVPDKLEILLVLALGKPAETVIIEPLPADGSVRYWRAADGTHHVPKRSLDDLIVPS